MPPTTKFFSAVLIFSGAVATALAPRAQAQTANGWNPASHAPSDGLWSDRLNWTSGHAPNAGQYVYFAGGAQPCVLDSTAGAAACSRLNLGDAGDNVSLIITNGGALEALSNYCAVGYSNTNCLLDVEEGCSAIFSSHLWIGFNAGATGALVMHGGTVTVGQMTGLGWNGGVGVAHIYGGTLHCQQFDAAQSIGPGSVLDVAGGAVIMSGNQVAAVKNYIAGGRITGYGGAGSLIVDYDDVNPGETTVEASKTDPSDGSWPQVIVPSLNTNELLVAVTTPQQYGAKGDGITDDSAAFQRAMDAVYNAGGAGGGVIYVPAAYYAFYTNIIIPTGVTLHGDWQDWTTGGTGLVGTTFKVYYGAGQTNAAPFIFLNGSTALRDVNIWYPNQNATNIAGYPFTIGLFGDCVVQNVVLVNSYQGIQVNAVTGGAKHILSTVLGTPLRMGISLDGIYDISHAEDIRFSPNVWPASALSNSPTLGGPQAAWMRAYGEGMQLLRVDGEVCLNIDICGYNVGIEANSSSNGSPGATFYSGSVSNCNIALLAQEMPFQSGLQFADFSLNGNVAVSHTSNSMATLQFYNCQLTGGNGTAVDFEGAAGNWISWAQFQGCAISGALHLGSGVFNVVNSSLTVPPGGSQCFLGANATRAAFTGCAFNPAQSIVNETGNPNSLILDRRRPISKAVPNVAWTNVVHDYLSRRPAKTNLFVATSYGATGNGATDDTAAIQSALRAAGTNGGGIVYLPGGDYRLSDTLDVPGGVVLQGTYEMRHRTWPGPDGIAKGAVLQPYGGQGTTNGPAAIALEANSGLVGVTISYETQTSNAIAFPPAIQGRGENVYVVGVVCPNPYWYVDMDTYTCLNHLIYMVDGWALHRGYGIGHGSSGSIVDCQGNWTYWWDNYASHSDLSTPWRSSVLDFAEHNLDMYVLGDCTELMVEDFVIPSHIFMRCIAENGAGPDITGVGTMCDETTVGFQFEAAASCNLTTVNSTLAIFADFADLTNTTAGVVSSNGFQGTARFFNTALFGGPYWDFLVGGGDLSFEQTHMLDHSFLGSRVDGGVFHLINNGAYISYNGASNFPPYQAVFGAGAGLPGKVSEMLGCYAYNGCSYDNLDTNNPVLAWVDYNLAAPLAPVNAYRLAPPPLSISSAGLGNGLVLSWPGAVGAFDVGFADDLAPPVTWQRAANVPFFSSNRWTLSLTNQMSAGFYRLQP